MNKLKIINDPIYGFITIPSELIYDIIAHQYFQRLRRITQMGLSYLVYPGANHTRFHHAIGCLFLMQKAINVLRFKGVEITSNEAEALQIAILLHDIGHGPFSHSLENSIVKGTSHEQISLYFMEVLNNEFNGRLSLAISIFKGEHPKKFLNQLISSQLDIDRLDYLKRDSFYTGVAEGNVNSERLITMLSVVDNKLVVEEKGIYSAEKFIIARRLMYWQVYLHKTSLVAEKLLVKVLQRAKNLVNQGHEVPASPTFLFFLKISIQNKDFDNEILEKFSKLDDFDIIMAIKNWQNHKDRVLSSLSKMIIQRKLPKVILNKKPFSKQEVEQYKQKIKKELSLTDDEITYFVFTETIENHAYSKQKDPIYILQKNGKIKDLVEASDHFNLEALTKPVVKHFIAYPKP
jgi:HD superfamily phosphohydrolase